MVVLRAREMGIIRTPVGCAAACDSVSRIDVICPRFRSIASAGDPAFIVLVKDDQMGLDYDHRLDHGLIVCDVITGGY